MSATATAPRLLAGVARRDITPPVGILHVNWGAATHTHAERIDMPMVATALAVRDGQTGTVAVLVDIDVGTVRTPLAATLRAACADATGVPLACIRVSATHTHSGPSLPGSWATDGASVAEAYLAALTTKVVEAAEEAVRGLRPARVALGTGRCRLAVNRRAKGPDGRVLVGRNRQGFVDRTVRVLRIDTANERPLAAVVHYACHPIIMAWENRAITPDYPGPTRQAVEALTGATCLFFQGCAGNIGPRDFGSEGRTGDPSLYRRAGAQLGAEAARVFLELEPLPRKEVFASVLESGAPLAVYRDVPAEEPEGMVRVETTRVPLPVRPFPTRAEGEASAAAAREKLARLRAAGADEEAVRTAAALAKRAAQQAGHARFTDGASEVEIELQAIRVGQAALLGAPMEVFSELGAEIAEASPFSWTAVSGYTNGSTGYLPTAEAHDEGGYEVEMGSPYARDAGRIFVQEATRLLSRLH